MRGLKGKICLEQSWLWKNVREVLSWVLWWNCDFFQSCIQQITAVLVFAACLPCIIYFLSLLGAAAVTDCPGLFCAAKPSTYFQAPLDGANISGIAQVSLPKLLLSAFISVFCSPRQNNFSRKINRSCSCWRRRQRSSRTWQTVLCRRRCQAPGCSSEPTQKRLQKERQS